MEKLLNDIKVITETITNDKDYKTPYYATTEITLFNEEMQNNDANGYDTKELIYGDPTNPYTISIYKIVEEGFLCDYMPDDFEYGFHDPYEPVKMVNYVIKNLDRRLTNAIANELKKGV